MRRAVPSAVAHLLGVAHLLAAAIGPAAAAGPSAAIGAWTTGLYTSVRPPDPPAPARRALPPEAACIGAILDAERSNGIGGHTLLAIGFTEAGRRTPDGLFTVWPWTVNAAGVSRYFASREDAIAFVRERQAAGVRSIDVGCMQVNLRWHPDAFPDLATAFDPAANAAYAGRLLSDLGAGRPLADAIARYHSAQSDLGTAYRERVEGNRRWVGHALSYLEALAAGPRPVAARAPYVWGRADLGRLSFLSSLYADGPVRPLLPKAVEQPG